MDEKFKPLNRFDSMALFRNRPDMFLGKDARPFELVADLVGSVYPEPTTGIDEDLANMPLFQRSIRVIGNSVIFTVDFSVSAEEMHSRIYQGILVPGPPHDRLTAGLSMACAFAETIEIQVIHDGVKTTMVYGYGDEIEPASSTQTTQPNSMQFTLSLDQKLFTTTISQDSQALQELNLLAHNEIVLSGWPLIPSERKQFVSTMNGDEEVIPIIHSSSADRQWATNIMSEVREYQWLWDTREESQSHIEPPLFILFEGVLLGTDAVRERAWQEFNRMFDVADYIPLSALAAIVGFVRIAAHDSRHDRVKALHLVRKIAQVPRSEKAIGHDELSPRERIRDVSDTFADAMLNDWANISVAIQRAQLGVLTALPRARRRYHALITECLPTAYQRAWMSECCGGAINRVSTVEREAFIHWLEGKE